MLDVLSRSLVLGLGQFVDAHDGRLGVGPLDSTEKTIHRLAVNAPRTSERSATGYGGVGKNDGNEQRKSLGLRDEEVDENGGRDELEEIRGTVSASGL